MMVARCFRQMRFAVVLFVACFTFGCATYPAFEDPNIDYNGRWDVQEGGWEAYYNPAVSMFDETPDYWYYGPVYGGYYYHYQGGDDPHRYRGR